ITAAHPMNKEHYISFVAFATGDRVQLIKQYPEWDMQLRIPKRGHGMLIWYCTRHRLYYQII
ncbi:MAG: XRE family transcriptional regulator, partial [Gammaproteobacteria bacterium]|nr:XRE family transcriptional regulator [Gammaproteobacteria bacterium]